MPWTRPPTFSIGCRACPSGSTARAQSKRLPSRGGGGFQELQRADQIVLQIAAVDDGVEEAFFEQELGALEAFGEFLADGLLDDARAGEADKRAGFGDVEIAEHG